MNIFLKRVSIKHFFFSKSSNFWQLDLWCVRYKKEIKGLVEGKKDKKLYEMNGKIILLT